MKKLSAVLAMLSFITLIPAGCAGNTSQLATAQINRNFTHTVTVEHSGTRSTASLKSDGSGCTAVFSVPEEISGVTVSYANGSLTYSLGELAFEDKPQSAQTFFLPLLCEAMEDSDAMQKRAEGSICLEGETTAGHYLLNINEKDFTPLYFEIDCADLTVKFG